MNAHRQKLASPAALIEMATSTLSRISRVAPRAGTESRLRLLGELSLVGIVVDGIEHMVLGAATGEVKQLPKARRALPPFRGGAGLRAAHTLKHITSKRLTAGRHT